MNIQKEIVEYYNKKISDRVDTSIKRRIKYWHVWVDLVINILLLILLGIFVHVSFSIGALAIGIVGIVLLGILSSEVSSIMTPISSL